MDDPDHLAGHNATNAWAFGNYTDTLSGLTGDDSLCGEAGLFIDALQEQSSDLPYLEVYALGEDTLPQGPSLALPSPGTSLQYGSGPFSSSHVVASSCNAHPHQPAGAAQPATAAAAAAAAAAPAATAAAVAALRSPPPWASTAFAACAAPYYSSSAAPQPPPVPHPMSHPQCASSGPPPEPPGPMPLAAWPPTDPAGGPSHAQHMVPGPTARLAPSAPEPLHVPPPWQLHPCPHRPQPPQPAGNPHRDPRLPMACSDQQGLPQPQQQHQQQQQYQQQYYEPYQQQQGQYTPDCYMHQAPHLQPTAAAAPTGWHPTNPTQPPADGVPVAAVMGYRPSVPPAPPMQQYVWGPTLQLQLLQPTPQPDPGAYGTPPSATPAPYQHHGAQPTWRTASPGYAATPTAATAVAPHSYQHPYPQHHCYPVEHQLRIRGQPGNPAPLVAAPTAPKSHLAHSYLQQQQQQQKQQHGPDRPFALHPGSITAYSRSHIILGAAGPGYATPTLTAPQLHQQHHGASALSPAFLQHAPEPHAPLPAPATAAIGAQAPGAQAAAAAPAVAQADAQAAAAAAGGADAPHLLVAEADVASRAFLRDRGDFRSLGRYLLALHRLGLGRGDDGPQYVTWEGCAALQRGAAAETFGPSGSTAAAAAVATCVARLGTPQSQFAAALRAVLPPIHFNTPKDELRQLYGEGYGRGGGRGVTRPAGGGGSGEGGGLGGGDGVCAWGSGMVPGVGSKQLSMWLGPVRMGTRGRDGHKLAKQEPCYLTLQGPPGLVDDAEPSSAAGAGGSVEPPAAGQYCILGPSYFKRFLMKDRSADGHNKQTSDKVGSGRKRQQQHNQYSGGATGVAGASAKALRRWSSTGGMDTRCTHHHLQPCQQEQGEQQEEDEQACVTHAVHRFALARLLGPAPGGVAAAVVTKPWAEAPAGVYRCYAPVRSLPGHVLYEVEVEQDAPALYIAFPPKASTRVGAALAAGAEARGTGTLAAPVAGANKAAVATATATTAATHVPIVETATAAAMTPVPQGLIRPFPAAHGHDGRQACAAAAAAAAGLAHGPSATAIVSHTAAAAGTSGGCGPWAAGAPPPRPGLPSPPPGLLPCEPHAPAGGDEVAGLLAQPQAAPWAHPVTASAGEAAAEVIAGVPAAAAASAVAVAEGLDGAVRASLEGQYGPLTAWMYNIGWEGLEDLPEHHPHGCGLLNLILSAAHRHQHPHLYGIPREANIGMGDSSSGEGGGGSGPGLGWPGIQDGVPALDAGMQQLVVRVFEVVFAQLPHLPLLTPRAASGAAPGPPGAIAQGSGEGGGCGGSGGSTPAAAEGPAGPEAEPAGPSRRRVLLMQADGTPLGDLALHTCCRYGLLRLLNLLLPLCGCTELQARAATGWSPLATARCRGHAGCEAAVFQWMQKLGLEADVQPTAAQVLFAACGPSGQHAHAHPHTAALDWGLKQVHPEPGPRPPPRLRLEVLRLEAYDTEGVAALVEQFRSVALGGGGTGGGGGGGGSGSGDGGGGVGSGGGSVPMPHPGG